MLKTKTIADARDEERAMLEQLNDSIDEARKVADKLWKLHEERHGAEGSYLDDEGKFTTSGERRLHRFFEEGAKNSEIARFFEVTDSAISYRRKQYNQKAA
ncbi:MULTISPECIES: hypothetical protein [Sphingomonas]|jgi:DNA-binding NarL/FixJ family response regulator|uniref:hypothetical protein n=1 Tax=Sphingomonas TaxID=13687 RepID=UPI00083204FF|nr:MULTISPECIES: hypothetical protein [Sphingomonas]PJI89282.1 hypothetical protein BDW16_2593 [Sphingomonas koreensis]RSU59778.1 hypothetical protein DAH56_10755 [Sphingomonas koreensis]RSU70828.1 hypothetical protein DAH55_02735 [Sphingomonas koreensis]RSV13304.1 hypothetical protein CA235_16485 [Sphingomonas sp. ABOLF]